MREDGAELRFCVGRSSVLGDSAVLRSATDGILRGMVRARLLPALVAVLIAHDDHWTAIPSRGVTKRLPIRVTFDVMANTTKTRLGLGA